MLQRSFGQLTQELYSTLHLTLPSEATVGFRIYLSHPSIVSTLNVYSKGVDVDYLKEFFKECGNSEHWDEVYGKPYGKLYMLCYNHKAKGIVTKMLLEGRTDFLAELDSFKLLYGYYHISPYILPACRLIINPRTFPFNFGLLSNITHTVLFPISYKNCIDSFIDISPNGAEIYLVGNELRFTRYLNHRHELIKKSDGIYVLKRPVKKKPFYGRPP